jgi:preprotein translocase subunit SecD
LPPAAASGRGFAGSPFEAFKRVRNRTWLTFAFVLVVALASVWLALPTNVLNFGGVKDRYPVKEGLDLQGGLQVVLQARPVAGQEIDQGTLEGIRTTLDRRINGLGVTEPLIQTRGRDQIIVELPGVDDPQQAVDVLQETALLEIVDPQGNYLPEGLVVNTSLGAAGPDATSSGGTATAGATPLAGASATDATPAASTPGAADGATPGAGAVDPAVDGPTFQTIVSGADLTDAYPATGQFGESAVAFELTADAGRRFFEFTSANLGRPMSIVIDKTVVSSATIEGGISTTGQLTGSFTPAEVQALSIQLKAGALAAPLTVEQSRTVGPTLGQDSIDRSLVAGVVGLSIVALFMILYYRLPGVLSVLALLIYTSIVFAVFKLAGVTLTLAGIAGFILSIGMAVDANVLIFARIKEELRQNQSLARAVESGFDHAWPSIRDSNVSTIITTVILYFFGTYTGTSIITGFATTLFIGVIVSMFTAIVATRTFMRLLVSQPNLQSRWLFGATQIRDATAASPAD